MENLLRNENPDVPEAIERLSNDFDYEALTKKFLNFLGQCKLSFLFVGNFNEAESRNLAKNFETNMGGGK
jgi:hypothetical protein